MQKTNAPSALGLEKAVFDFSGLNCCLIETTDGSFSLRYREHSSPSDWTEPMHSSKGAWAETLHVYEPALRESLSRRPEDGCWRVASVGLGLGYNEILCAALALRSQISPQNIMISSFESQPALQQAFLATFTKTSTLDEKIPAPLSTAQNVLLNLVCQHTGVPRDSLLGYIKNLCQLGSLKLHGALTTASISRTALTQKNACVLFDAFSPDSSPDLWDEGLLNALIENLCAPQCIFASYASRNILKKSLRKHGFMVHKKSGFAGKRELTFASR